MPNTTYIGNLSMAKAMLRFQEKGYRICIPFGDGFPYDFIADDGNKLTRVQVKTGILKVDHIEAKAHSSIGEGRKRLNKGISYVGLADIIVVYCPQTNKCYSV